MIHTCTSRISLVQEFDVNHFVLSDLSQSIVVVHAKTKRNHFNHFKHVTHIKLAFLLN